MKIAIAAPSPVPFTIGGAEKLWWGLQEYINKYTSHQCELIKIPVEENDFQGLIKSYKNFYDLDLSYFDLVLSTKYPAWLVKHDNHICYMQHCLRGLYDTYPFSSPPWENVSCFKTINDIKNGIKNNRTDIPALFSQLDEIINDPSVPPELFDFPGDFIRTVIHYLDKQAMKGIKRFFAISRTVQNRKEYFPPGAPVEIVYHPSNLNGFNSFSYDYFFTASRLDGPKRIKMIIDAYMKSDTSIPLKIAGTGPLENELQECSKDDQRIEFLGFISDKDLLDYYANAFAVIFVPHEEDYGLVTIEAMMSGKPVISFNDSGGVKEFVINGETGFLSDPSIDGLKSMIEKMSGNKNFAVKMGGQGKKRVKTITWENTVSSLFGFLTSG